MVNGEKSGDTLAEDVLGFGGRELVTARDLFVRPDHVLAAWMDHGPDGGGRYARPLRLYLALNAFLMLILFLQGGAGFLLADLPAGLIDPLVARSGKSMDAFTADADGWMTLVMVPVISSLQAIVAAPLFRLWDPDHLGWRKGLRATFGWLCAWTVLMLPLAWWSYGRGSIALLAAAGIVLLGIVAFVRMGRGRWFRSRSGAAGKAAMIMVAVQLAGSLGAAIAIGIGLLGATSSP